MREKPAELLRLGAGDTVFRQGDAGDAAYVVLDGKVELRVAGRLVETVGPGGILGEMALIDQAPRVATATARGECDLLPISQAKFMAMIQKTPHFALQIMKVMAARLRTMNARATKQRARKLAKKRVRGTRGPTSRTRAGR